MHLILHPFSNEIWKNLYRVSKKIEKDMPLKGTSINSLPININERSWWNSDYWINRRFTGYCIKNIVPDYFSNTEKKILEIGCGKLFFVENDPHPRSYLSAVFPECSEWRLTDHHLTINDGAGCFDLENGEMYSEGRYSRIIGCNVLDTIPYENLGLAMKSIAYTLKQNGVFLHLATSNFYLSTFINACASSAEVLLPGDRGEIYLLSNQEIDQAINDKSFSRFTRAFLRKWINYDLQVQCVALNDLFRNKAISEKAFKSLKKRMMLIFPQAHIEKIEELFVRYLSEAAEQNLLEIGVCEYRKGIDERNVHVFAVKHKLQSK